MANGRQKKLALVFYQHFFLNWHQKQVKQHQSKQHKYNLENHQPTKYVPNSNILHI